ncbi:MAG: glycosyltransferase family 2 protein [Bacteroidota bacterium]|nr:glycosyltransferase family 2 protein [Bacteroidota bacterium]MDP4215147.1 glycosyltransferase family 2 protein [Bacteroidota bacterium]MDP4246505.1 glycosyltransferase family 2 protein [Bacteroidota bacterium]MDP4254333.1 glycosyltransferase family 2 protein [Bacteroidota bacterium]MDP4260380.1 glycosyltransferase family 2 protein [Bacteroidota bacterium]
MVFWEYTFFVSCFVILYNYAGYALIARIANEVKRKFRPRYEPDNTHLPSVSFIVAAFNEEDCIEQKILNSLEQDYPGEKIEFLFITDGSTDGTAALINKYPGVRGLHEPERKGKSAAVNRAVQYATGEILIFSDANTMLNAGAVRHIARHYAQPKIGGVAGEKKVMPAGEPSGGTSDESGGTSDEVGAGEGFYWKYESFLKRVDSEFYSVVGAAGELFSLRRDLYEPLPHHVILDDFVLSLRVATKGYRILYEPEAYAMELPSFSLTDENKRKVRIAAGGFQAMGMLWPLLAFWRQPALSFLYISHRVLRWTLSPLCFILALLSNTILVFAGGAAGGAAGGPAAGPFEPGGAGLAPWLNTLFRVFFAAQILFYGLALAGKFAGPRTRQSKWLKLPYYFVFMNVSVIQGFFRHLKGRQAAAWEKARRQPGQARSAPAK